MDVVILLAAVIVLLWLVTLYQGSNIKDLRRRVTKLERWSKNEPAD